MIRLTELMKIKEQVESLIAKELLDDEAVKIQPAFVGNNAFIMILYEDTNYVFSFSSNTISKLKLCQNGTTGRDYFIIRDHICDRAYINLTMIPDCDGGGQFNINLSGEISGNPCYRKLNNFNVNKFALDALISEMESVLFKIDHNISFNRSKVST